jgi:hypothetical protein
MEAVRRGKAAPGAGDPRRRAAHGARGNAGSVVSDHVNPALVCA